MKELAFWWPILCVALGTGIVCWQMRYYRKQLEAARKQILSDKDREIERLRQRQLDLLHEIQASKKGPPS